MIIYSHNRVISSLDTSTNVILPLVGLEASMIIGNNTEKKSQAVTGELISLFKNVINQNVLGIQDDLKKLKSSSFDSDKLDYLSISMNNYIDSNSDNSKKR